ncbi:MAG: MFS transporter, partial [Paracoccus sp. (in: a-proteobacteria)]|nr:MFS transporter [Paracoccus sp. (in: a-proteobacteria)]
MTNGKLGVSAMLALVVAHCAGMIDLVALPVWVGALIGRFGFTPQQAGGLVTLFLLGAVAASAVVAPRFNKIHPRLVAAGGFAIGAAGFALASTRTDFAGLGVLHALTGVAVGAALSAVHGTMGRTANPHRTFGIATVAIGAFGIIALGVLPQIIIAQGGAALFIALAAVMAVAALACAVLFPPVSVLVPEPDRDLSGLGAGVWLVILGISAMTFNQAMVFSFVEVIGKARGFPEANVLAVLIALGVVNFVLVGPAAMLLEKRLRPETVVRIGPAVQAAFALVVTGATAFTAWAPVAAMFVAVQIFTHTFAFGLLARMDPSGRAVAATPAMLMSGAALGPIVGGALAQQLGYHALGYAAVVVAAVSITLFTMGCARG